MISPSSLMYGSGLRVMEAVRLRVQDIDFGQQCLIIREAKSDKWRRTLLPRSLMEPLQAQITITLAVHQQDLNEGYSAVYMPFALAKKYPKASTSPAWQYVFPPPNRANDPRGQVGSEVQHHLWVKGRARRKNEGIVVVRYSDLRRVFATTPGGMHRRPLL